MELKYFESNGIIVLESEQKPFECFFLMLKIELKNRSQKIFLGIFLKGNAKLDVP